MTLPALGQLQAHVRRHAIALRSRTSSAAHGQPDGCAVCGGARSAFEPVTFTPQPHLTRDVSVCSACGYVAIREQSQDRYRGKTTLDELPDGGTRIGTEDRPGREFHMARMAVDILRRSDLDVMVYGIGRSLDNHHIAAMRRVRGVAIGDIMKVRDDAEFHDVNQPARKRFPVVASEVVEHFRDPLEDFRKLFGFVARDGLLVCGTNVYGGGDLTRDRYLYYPDHTSYYSPDALLMIARRHGFLLDFRTPRRAGLTGRKRYVLLTRSPRVLQNIALYFASTTMAPSE